MTPKEKFKQLTNLDYNAASIIRLNSTYLNNIIMKRVLLAVTLLMIAFLSYAQKILTQEPKTGNEKNISVNTENLETYKFSDIVESVKILPLIIEDSVNIPEIFHIEKKDGIIIANGKQYQNRFLFDEKGEFIASLCKVIGHDKDKRNNYSGNCQYTHLSCIDHYNKAIVMTDGDGGLLRTFSYSGESLTKNSYDVLDDQAILSIKDGLVYILNGYYTKMEKANPGMNNRPTPKYNSTLVILKGNKTIQSIPRFEWACPREFTEASELSKEYLLHFNASDTIYSLNKKSAKVESKYIIDFGDKKYPDKLSEMSYNDWWPYRRTHQDQAGFVSTFFSTNKNIYFSYWYNGMACDFIYNTKNGNSINGSIDYDIFDDSDINLVGTTPESFLFVVSNPADLKLTESGKQLMSSSDIEKFESIDSKTKYMILEVSLKEKF